MYELNKEYGQIERKPKNNSHLNSLPLQEKEAQEEFDYFYTKT
jgi:hypothetical protein